MTATTSVSLTIGIGAILLNAAELSPSLEVLPLNSTLSDVTIPRYDENQNRVAYLKSDLMEILADGPPVDNRQPIMVDCTGIKLRMAYEAADGEVSVDMERSSLPRQPGRADGARNDHRLQSSLSHHWKRWGLPSRYSSRLYFWPCRVPNFSERNQPPILP